MSPRDVFGIVIRSFGLWMLYCGVVYGFSAIDVTVTEHDPWGFKPESYVFTSIWMTAGGVYLLRGAPFLLNLAYPVPKEAAGTNVEPGHVQSSDVLPSPATSGSESRLD